MNQQEVIDAANGIWERRAEVERRKQATIMELDLALERFKLEIKELAFHCEHPEEYRHYGYFFAGTENQWMCLLCDTRGGH